MHISSPSPKCKYKNAALVWKAAHFRQNSARSGLSHLQTHTASFSNTEGVPSPVTPVSPSAQARRSWGGSPETTRLGTVLDFCGASVLLACPNAPFFVKLSISGFGTFSLYRNLVEVKQKAHKFLVFFLRVRPISLSPSVSKK
jgi:hypothetical protein